MLPSHNQQRAISGPRETGLRALTMHLLLKKLLYGPLTNDLVLLAVDQPDGPTRVRNGVEAIQQWAGVPCDAPDEARLLHGLHPEKRSTKGMTPKYVIQPLAFVHPCVTLTAKCP